MRFRWFRPFRSSRWAWWIVAAIAAVALLLVWPRVAPAFSGSVKAAADVLGRTGRWGPFVVVGLQLLQAVISPLPAWPVTVAAGALYGPWWGTLYSLIGGSIGAAVNFLLARRLGVPLVRRTLGETWVQRAGRLGALHFLVLSLLGRLIPVVSFDAVAYIAGISRMELAPFLGVATLGQAPAFFAYAYFGSDLAAARGAGLQGSLLMLLFVGLIAGGRHVWQKFAAS
ncbi:MAG TPA: TVP38/TMEM64 family protein [Symbiobacteriaceae bacterium]|jgi:uncharacterized membrane protein YdjX (TVP38/TMEM64 family)